MSRRSTNGISIYTSSTREPSPQKHGGPDGTGCAPSAMLAQKRSLADPPPSHDGQSQAIVAPAQRRLLHVARTLAHDRSRWGSLNSALTASSDDWHALEAPVNDIGSLLAQEPDPFRSMAEMKTPGVIIRGAYPAADVPKLVQRLIDRRLMRGPDDPVELTADGTLSDVLRDENGRVFKGSKYLRPEANGRGPRRGMGGWTPSRIDIGTSFGGGWPDKEAFIDHSAGTAELFSTLFDGLADPVAALYSCCSGLAGNTQQRVTVAHEPDGRSYGPAIFRVHYSGHDYQPHINHVGQTERARRLHNLPAKSADTPPYEVFRYDHQLAALICVQHTTLSRSHGHSSHTKSGEQKPLAALTFHLTSFAVIPFESWFFFLTGSIVHKIYCSGLLLGRLHA